jgi:hypothetical protein
VDDLRAWNRTQAPLANGHLRPVQMALMRTPRSAAEKVIVCAVGAVAVWFLTIVVGFSPRRNLPTTLGAVIFELLWLSFPGLIVGGFWSSRGPNGRFPLFAAAVTAVGLIWSAHGFDIQADPLAALTIVFAPLYVGCIAVGAIAVTLLAQWIRRSKDPSSDASP